MTSAVLADWRTAAIPERLRAMLAFLEKLTLTPDDLGPDDVRTLRTQGLSDEAVQDAITVSAAFNTIDRIADAFCFHIRSPAAFASDAKQLLKRGYVI